MQRRVTGHDLSEHGTLEQTWTTGARWYEYLETGYRKCKVTRMLWKKIAGVRTWCAWAIRYWMQ